MTAARWGTRVGDGGGRWYMEHERRRREEPEPVLLDQDIDLQARAGAPSQRMWATTPTTIQPESRWRRQERHRRRDRTEAS
jgi:hypothetical protein